MYDWHVTMYNDYNLCGISAGGMKTTEKEKSEKGGKKEETEEWRERENNAISKEYKILPEKYFIYNNSE